MPIQKGEMYIMKVNERLKELRKETNLTQDKFAESVNISRELQQKYENGERNITIEYLNDICNKYNVSADWLLGRSEYKNGIDIMVSVVLSLHKIMKVGYRHIHNDGETYHEPVLWIDETFAKYLQEIDELQRLRNLRETESFSLLISEVQKKYEKYFQKLLGTENCITSESNFKEIEAVEIAEFLTNAYCKI